MCSSRLCRPIEFEYVKEEKTITKQKHEFYRNEIANLQPSFVKPTLTINHRFHNTMNDGKVICALTGIASTSCTICNAKLAEIQDLRNNFEPTQKGLEFGMTSLHLWINCLTNMLQLSYRLDLRDQIIRYKSMKPQPDKVEANQLIHIKMNENRKIITNQIFQRLGLRCDKIVTGKGTSNTGNVSRRFFKNYEIISEITDINKEMLKNIYICMICMTSTRFKINVQNFKVFSRKVYEDYVRLYSPIKDMSPSLHKLLQHTADLALHFDAPLGQFSEESLEKSHQFGKKANKYFCRQVSRIARNEDLITRWLAETDPTVGDFRMSSKDEHLPLPLECWDLLVGKSSNILILKFI